MIDRISGYFDGRWRQGYVRGKLRSDPVYEAVFERLKASERPVLDVGCGLGLLGFYLRERGFTAPVVGVDFDSGKIAQAEQIASRAYAGLKFEVGDVLSATATGGHVVLLDVLHYLPMEHQQPLLENLAQRVAPGALCLIRATPRDGSWRFRLTQIEEFFLRASRWMKSGARHYPTAEEIVAPFRARGFDCEVRPLWGRTPFNSYLFACQAPA